jgi:DnaJ family protein C protein 2
MFTALAINISLTVLMFDMLGLIKVRYEPVGRWYESYCSRRYHKQTLSHGSAASSSSDEDDAQLSPDEEDDMKLLETLDPKEWKVCDCYEFIV